MLKHVVLFKFKENIGEKEIKELEGLMATLPGRITEIEGYEFGVDVLRSERSYDFALVSTFEDLQAMKRYQAHPDHQVVLGLLGKMCEKIRAVDFEC